MQEQHIITISTNHPCFPEAFHHVKPIVTTFYAHGNIQLLKQAPRLAVVGTRHPSHYGIDATKHLVRTAAKANITIVSGLALGIDSVAHGAALDYGTKTIAVLPTSLSNIYPLRHTNLARRILANNGLLISELVSTANPNKYHFVQRNRLIAALADLIVVPEAAVNSGARHTVEFGHQLGKTSAFIPGPINSQLSVFPNQQIKTGGALIAESTDIFDLLPFHESLIGDFLHTPPPADNPHQQMIISALAPGPLFQNELLKATKQPAQTLNVHLTMLEIKGSIERTSNNAWRLAN